ncbi:MAG: hypothetical protein Q7R95_10005 [bacterium]|nr:hypothetical protein [bacterium]
MVTKIQYDKLSNIILNDKQGGSHFKIYTGIYNNEHVIIKSIRVRNIENDMERQQNNDKFLQELNILELRYPGMVSFYGWGDDWEENNFLVEELLYPLPDRLEKNVLQNIFYTVFSVTRRLYLNNFNWTPSVGNDGASRGYCHILSDKYGNPKLIDFNDDNDIKKSFLNSKDYYDYSDFLKRFSNKYNYEIGESDILQEINLTIDKIIIEEYQSLLNVHQPIWFDCFKNIPKKETDPNDINFGKLVMANRTCTDRALIMRENINFDLNSQTLLDLGTNVGWFCFYFNNLGLKTTGIDFDAEKIKFNKLLSERFNVGCKFSSNNINLDFIKQIQDYDIILGLSIFHLFFTQHKYNKENWVILMKAICSKVKKLFIIEVSNEVFSCLNISSFDELSCFMKNIGGFSISKIIGTSNEGRPLILCERR